MQLWFGQLKYPVLRHGCRSGVWRQDSCCALGSFLTHVLYLVVLSVSIKYHLKEASVNGKNYLACGVIVCLQ